MGANYTILTTNRPNRVPGFYQIYLPGKKGLINQRFLYGKGL
jgi:hypothetical protein